MDVAVLSSVTADLAAVLSEISRGDLARPIPQSSQDVRGLYAGVVEQNARIAVAITGEDGPRRLSIDVGSVSSPPGADLHGGGLDREYRRVARLAGEAFASVDDAGQRLTVEGRQGTVDAGSLFEIHLRSTVLATWDIAGAIGLDHRPSPEVTARLFQAVRALPVVAGAGGDRSFESIHEANAFGYILALSGRRGAP